MALSDKQQVAREQKLGSSDAPVVAGLSDYSSPLELYYKLTGQLPRYSPEETQQQRIGSRLEPVIAELAAEDLGLRIRRIATRVSKKHPFMVAHPDYEIVNHANGPGLMEVKNRSALRSVHELPDDIAAQVAHQLAVTEKKWALVVMLLGFGALKTFEVFRDPELEEYLIELEARFMAHVERCEPPDHTWTPATVGILKKLYPFDSGKTIPLPERCLDLIVGFLQAKQDMGKAETEKAFAEGQLKEQLEDS